MSNERAYQPLSQSEPSIQGSGLQVKPAVSKPPRCASRRNVTLRTWIEAIVRELL